MTRRKLPHEKLKPGPKPRALAPAVLPPAPQVESDSTLRAAPRWDDPLQRNRPVDSMDEPELRQYGLQIGLTKRDAADLSVERLRVACKHRINDLIEEI